MDVIVLAVAVFTTLMTIAWALSPNLRVWIERPKYRFLAGVQGYDEMRHDEMRDDQMRHHGAQESGGSR